MANIISKVYIVDRDRSLKPQRSLYKAEISPPAWCKQSHVSKHLRVMDFFVSSID